MDTQSLQIIQHHLNGANCKEWSQSVVHVTIGKGKVGYLDCSIPLRKKDSATCGSWEAENSIAMAWLINSMEPKIGKNIYPKDCKRHLGWRQSRRSILTSKTRLDVLKSVLPFQLQGRTPYRYRIL